MTLGIVWNLWVLWAAVAVYAVTILSCIIVVLSENRNPIRSLAWVIALIFLPVVGLVFYLFFGRSLKGIRMISRHNKRKLLHNNAPRRIDINSLPITPDERQLIKLAHTVCRAPFTVNNNIEIFTDGPSKFRALKEDLLAAQQSILLQYYIFLDDELGRQIADILIEKARQGVKVHVIYDHVGSFSSHRSFFRRMEQAGVETHPFFRVTFPQLANRINWRNHRKIVVIDRRIGYIGGMNIAERYIAGLPDGSLWRDTHFRLTGDIVSSLLFSFIVDWNFLKKDPYVPRFDNLTHTLSNSVGMQLVVSGPVDSWNNIELCFLKAISGAKRSIFIQTPYFLPTDTLMHALEAAAFSKVDVRVMLPSKCDSLMLQHASFSYITSCLKAGIKVYLYNPGMLHAKSMTVDDSLVIAGSANFDFRSFENNFECNLLIYDSATNRKMRDIFFADLAFCRKLTLPMWRERPLPQKFMESSLRLLSPIL